MKNKTLDNVQMLFEEAGLGSLDTRQEPLNLKDLKSNRQISDLYFSEKYSLMVEFLLSKALL